LDRRLIYKFQYCGYDLKEYNKKTNTIIQKKLNAVIGEFKAGKIFTSDKKLEVFSMNNAGKANKKGR
jgi:hypothetical protein